MFHIRHTCYIDSLCDHISFNETTEKELISCEREFDIPVCKKQKGKQTNKNKKPTKLRLKK